MVVIAPSAPETASHMRPVRAGRSATRPPAQCPAEKPASTTAITAVQV